MKVRGLLPSLSHLHIHFRNPGHWLHFLTDYLMRLSRGPTKGIAGAGPRRKPHWTVFEIGSSSKLTIADALRRQLAVA